MPAKNMHRLAKGMRWAGRIICLVITVFEGTMLIGIVALAGCILSWRQDLLAGILLDITSAGLGIHIGIFAGRNHFMAWSMLGGPCLIAGLSLFCAWRLSKHKEQTAVIPSNLGAGKKQ